jgi:hypothetical protein
MSVTRSLTFLWTPLSLMDTKDVIPAGKPGATPSTRREAIKRLSDPATWASLKARMNVVIQPFSTEKSGHGSDLYTPIAKAQETMPNLMGVVMASDATGTRVRPQSTPLRNSASRACPCSA